MRSRGPHLTPQRRRRPRCRMTNGASGRSSCMDPIRTCKYSNPEHSAPPGRPPGSPESPSRRLTLTVLTPAAGMSAKPERLRTRSKTLGLVHRPHEPTQKPRGGHHRTNSAHGSALPSAHDSHADDRDVHGECARNSIKVPTKFIVKVGQRPRAVPGSLQGPPGDPPLAPAGPTERADERGGHIGDSPAKERG